jgi:integrase/recombinase XerD
MLFKNAMLNYEEYIKFRNLSQSTINGYRKELKYLLEYLEKIKITPIYLDKLTFKDLESYIKYKKENGSELVSINRSISIIKGFFIFLESRGIINANPSHQIETYRIINRPEREVLTEEEIETLIENINNCTVRYAVKTMANTGLRISELTNLKLEDVDFKNKVIKVIDGKGGKNRLIPINTALYEDLKRYLEEIRPQGKSNYFFATKQTGRLSRQWTNINIKKTINELNWDIDITSHNLRHSFATNLINNNANIVAVQKLLGHNDLRTTSIYLHQSINELHDAVNLLCR